MKGFDEKRKTMRFRMNLPIELNNGTGVTRNVSMKGVFFETDQTFSVGETVEFTIAMQYAMPDPLIRLRCQGTILRLEPASAGTGVAAALTSSSFENAHVEMHKEKLDQGAGVMPIILRGNGDVH